MSDSTATYTCDACAIRWVEADGATCPGCRRAAPVLLSLAVRRLLDEIDRTQRSGRTLVGFPTELLAAVEDVREALGGQP